jgi:hypothetical protein
MLKQKNLINTIILSLLVPGLVACSSQPNVHLQIAKYEESEKEQPYYTPMKKSSNGINDEMSAYVVQAKAIESNDPSFRASMAINELTGIVQDTIETNNAVANMKLDSVLESKEPLAVGMKFAENWQEDNMEKIRQIADAKIAKAKEAPYVNLSTKDVSLASQNFATHVEKVFEGQEIMILTDKQYSNYYDIIALTSL